MKQVYKCDFCIETGEKEKIERHESECEFNPKTKKCETCKFWYEAGAPISGFWDACKKGININALKYSGKACDQYEEFKNSFR